MQGMPRFDSVDASAVRSDARLTVGREHQRALMSHVCGRSVRTAADL